jgi:hypothetical protein
VFVEEKPHIGNTQPMFQISKTQHEKNNNRKLVLIL